MVVYQAIYEDSCGDISYGNLFRKKEDCLEETKKLTSKPTIEDYYKFLEDNNNGPFISFDEWANYEYSNPYSLVRIKKLTVH